MPRTFKLPLDARITQWAGPAVVAAAGCLMVWWSWGTWPDLLVDFGRELYTPWQLTRGKVLYRDVASFYGPLSPYLNSAWMRLLGVSLWSIVFANIVIAGALTWMLYRILLTIGGRLSAVVGSLVFITTFACSRLIDMGNFNFITPYSHELTHGVFLSVAAIVSFRRYLRGRSNGALVATGALLGLTFLTKPEVFAAVLSGISGGLLIDAWLASSHPRIVLRSFAVLLAAALVPVVTAMALFSIALPLPQAIAAVMSPWRPILDPALRKALTSLRFYRLVAGTLEAPGRIVLLLLWTFWYTAILAPAYLVARRKFLARVSDNRYVAALVFLVVGVVTIVTFGYSRYWPWTASALPVVLSAWIAALLIALVRRPAHLPAERLTLMATWAAFSLIMLWKMILAVQLAHYGFALAMPATLGMIAVVCDVIPDRIARHGGSPLLFRATALGILAALIWASVNTNSRLFHAQATNVAGDGTDMFLSDRRSPLVNAAVADLKHRLSPSDTLLVVPEGVMLNYLSRRDSPTPFINFMPPELLVFGEDNIVSTLRRHPPDYVMMADKDTSEYGAYFGSDRSRRVATRRGWQVLPPFGSAINDWVMSEYEPVMLFGNEPLRDGRFGLKLLKRRADLAAARR